MEKWKNIECLEFAAGYEVSNLGRVRFRYRTTQRTKAVQPFEAVRDGHMTVKVYAHGDWRLKSVHTLVMEAFNPSPSANLVCQHIDGNKANNELANLRWISKADAWATSPRKLCKFSDDQVRTVRRYLSIGVTVSQVASYFDVKPSVVYAIKYGRTYNWVE